MKEGRSNRRGACTVLRRLQLAERLGAHELGDVRAALYEDVVRPAGDIRNARGMDVAIYDPGLDADLADAHRLADLLVAALT